MKDFDVKAAADMLKAAIDASIEMEKLPGHITRTRNGWAGYKGATRITRFYFSESGAAEAVVARDASDVKVTFVDS